MKISNKKYVWIVHAIIYNHAKFELQPKLIDGATKKKAARFPLFCCALHKYLL
jgi:hypothetical protein